MIVAVFYKIIIICPYDFLERILSPLARASFKISFKVLVLMPNFSEVTL